MKASLFIICFIVLAPVAFAQRSREVENQNQFWTSINTNNRISKKWSLLADFHMRRTDFLARNNFFFLRFGAGYAVTDNLMLAAGYGHLLLSNKKGATELFSNEDRIFQQVVYNSTIGKVLLSNNLRIEERWQQKVVNFQPQSGYRYTTRFRYQLSLTVPISTKKNIPSLVVADEIMLQTGKNILYNNFDQNRFFAGIKQRLTSNLSFDFGYMHLWQQKLSGYQYSRNRTIRLFFYWKPDWRKKHKTPPTAFQMADE